MKPLRSIPPHCATAVFSLFLLCATRPATAQVPSYRVQPVATYAVTTTLRGASDAGHMVGWQIVGGQVVPFLATPTGGLVQLPLPPGYNSGFANDANSAGVIVGAVDEGGFPFDLGEPAIWTPNPGGGYSVSIPQQFQILPSPIRPLPISGGQAVAINDNGVIVGWSRYFGFQGGPTTRFFVSGPPIDLRAQGFDATVTALSDTTDLIVGDGLMMDLNSGVVTSLGVPPPSFGSFVITLASAINDSAQVIASLRRSTSLPDAWLTFRYTPAGGWIQHNPSVLPGVFPSFADNNDRGDVSAGGGIYFAAEDTLVGSYNSLLEPGSNNWRVSTGFIADDRRVYTGAVDNSTGTSALVMLVPQFCQTDLGSQGPGTATASLCGTGLALGSSSDYAIQGAPSAAAGVLLISLAGLADVPALGGTLVSFNGIASAPILADASGAFGLTIAGVPTTSLDLVLQSVFLDAGLPNGFAFTNAVLARLGR